MVNSLYTPETSKLPQKNLFYIRNIVNLPLTKNRRTPITPLTPKLIITTTLTQIKRKTLPAICIHTQKLHIAHNLNIDNKNTKNEEVSLKNV